MNEDRDTMLDPEPRGLSETLREFKGQRCVVIGEAIVDSYLYGSPRRLCREAPVPVIDSEQIFLAPGGAANTAVNLAGLGAKTSCFTVIGKDRQGMQLCALLEEKGVNTDNILTVKNRRTLYKQRIYAGTQMLLRVDSGSCGRLEPEIEERMARLLEALFESSQALVISDYDYGLISPKVIQVLTRLQKNNPKILAIDAKDLERYSEVGAVLIKPNYFEAVRFLGIPVVPPNERADQIIRSGPRLLAKAGAEIAAVTLDSQGAVILDKGHKAYRIYARAHSSPSEAGAGDTFISAFVLALVSGADSSQAGEIASAAAAVAVGKRQGTASCSWNELRGYLSLENKLIQGTVRLKELKDYYRSQGMKIVFTNGCFDILHRGHTHFLSQCKSLGDVLVVAVNSDAGIRKLRGANRPINSLADRTQILCSLSCVDHVIGFEEDSPLEIIDLLKPDLFAKAANHHIENLPEVPLVIRQGGEVRILPYLEEYSTVDIIQRASVQV